MCLINNYQYFGIGIFLCRLLSLILGLAGSLLPITLQHPRAGTARGIAAADPLPYFRLPTAHARLPRTFHETSRRRATPRHRDKQFRGSFFFFRRGQPGSR
jgi:hypothetical protein